MKKKSPFKTEDINGSHSNASVNYVNKNDNTYSKNERSNRFDLLLKNHGKCSTLNQMVIDLFKLDLPKSLYISYYLFKNIEKEVNSLS